MGIALMHSGAHVIGQIKAVIWSHRLIEGGGTPPLFWAKFFVFNVKFLAPNGMPNICGSYGNSRLVT